MVLFSMVHRHLFPFALLALLSCAPDDGGGDDPTPGPAESPMCGAIEILSPSEAPCTEVGSGGASVYSSLGWTPAAAGDEVVGAWLTGTISIEGETLSITGGAETHTFTRGSGDWSDLSVVPGPGRIWYELSFYGDYGVATAFAAETADDTSRAALASPRAGVESLLPPDVADAWGLDLAPGMICDDTVQAPDACGDAAIRPLVASCDAGDSVEIHAGETAAMGSWSVELVKMWDYVNFTCDEGDKPNWAVIVRTR